MEVINREEPAADQSAGQGPAHGGRLLYTATPQLTHRSETRATVSSALAAAMAASNFILSLTSFLRKLMALLCPGTSPLKQAANRHVFAAGLGRREVIQMDAGQPGALGRPGDEVVHHLMGERPARLGIFVTDVSMEQDVAAAISAAEAASGRVGVLVNNAGVITTALLADLPVPMWDEMIAVNLRRVFLCSKAVLPGMARRRFGRIVNISSQLGHKGVPNMVHYAAAKAALIGFTRSLAREAVRDGINVNAICPGAIKTELGGDIPPGLRMPHLAEIPLGQFGAVGEIAPTAVLLASSDGDYSVGTKMNLSGGDVVADWRQHGA